MTGYIPEQPLRVGPALPGFDGMHRPSFIPSIGRAGCPSEAARGLYMRLTELGPEFQPTVPLLVGAAAIGAQFLQKSTVLFKDQIPNWSSHRKISVHMDVCSRSLSPK